MNEAVPSPEADSWQTSPPDRPKADKTDFLELGREVFRGQDLAIGAGSAPFQPVTRQVRDGGLDPLGGNVGGLLVLPSQGRGHEE